MDDEELHALIDRAYRYALSLTHDDSRAEDLVQDAWTKLLAGGHPLELPYFLRTVRNNFIDRYRQHQRTPLVALTEAEAFVDDPELDVQVANLSELEPALAQLSPIERELLLMTAVEGWTIEEVARHQGVPRGTAASMLRRVKRTLARRLTTRGVAP